MKKIEILNQEYLDRYENCAHFLSENYRIEDLNKYDTIAVNDLISKLIIFEGVINLELIDAIKVYHESFHYIHCFVSYDLEIVTSSKTGVSRSIVKESYQFTIMELNRFFGHSLIRPEKLSDKISEIFNRRELDFSDHKEFSKNYYFLSDNEDLTRSSVNWRFLDTINSYKNLIIEMIDNKLVLTQSKILDLDITQELAYISFKIQNSFS